eukprot:gene451-2439_t
MDNWLNASASGSVQISEERHMMTTGTIMEVAATEPRMAMHLYDHLDPMANLPVQAVNQALQVRKPAPQLHSRYHHPTATYWDGMAP